VGPEQRKGNVKWSRHRLDFGSIGEVKLAHLKYVGTRKPAAKSCRQFSGELFHNALSVVHPLSATLLLLKNPLPSSANTLLS
jgi:hypothetical protein